MNTSIIFLVPGNLISALIVSYQCIDKKELVH